MMRSLNITILIIVLGVSLCAKSQIYTLDENFKDNGTFLYSEETLGFIARELLVDNDQIIIAGGHREGGGITNILYPDSILRIISLSPDGNLNQEFGTNGQMSLKFNEKVEVKTIHNLTNGFLITLMNTDFYSQTACLSYIVGINKAGDVLPNFGIDGVLDLTGEEIMNITLNDNESIFACGQDLAVSEEVYIKKFTPQGDLDLNFGMDGMRTYALASSIVENLVYEQNHLHLIATERNNVYRYNVLKIDSAGDIVENFGNNGLAQSAVFEFDFGLENRIGQVASKIKNGNIFITGIDNSAEGQHICVIDSTGFTRQNYGDTGIAKLQGVVVEDFVLDDDLGLLVLSPSNHKHRVIRLDSLGQEDLSFGSGGELDATISDFTEEATLTIEATRDGFIVAGISVMNGDSMALSVSKFKQTETSITDMESPKLASIFPNPAQNTLHLPQELATLNLKLYNSQGQQFEAVQPTAAKLDVSHLAPGMYMLQAGERVWRFVKE